MRSGVEEASGGGDLVALPVARGATREGLMWVLNPERKSCVFYLGLKNLTPEEEVHRPWVFSPHLPPPSPCPRATELLLERWLLGFEHVEGHETAEDAATGVVATGARCCVR